MTNAEFDITMVGQVGVDGYFNQYKKTIGA